MRRGGVQSTDCVDRAVQENVTLVTLRGAGSEWEGVECRELTV